MAEKPATNRWSSEATCKVGDDEKKAFRTLRRSNDTTISADLESQSQGQESPRQESQSQQSESRRPLKQENEDPDLVDWEGPNDPGNPQNWPKSKKWLTTMALASITFCVTFASSVFSAATVVTSRKFHVSTEVMVLGTSLFILVHFLPLRAVYKQLLTAFRASLSAPSSLVPSQNSLAARSPCSRDSSSLRSSTFQSRLPRMYRQSCCVGSSAASLAPRLWPSWAARWQTFGIQWSAGLLYASSPQRLSWVQC